MNNNTTTHNHPEQNKEPDNIRKEHHANPNLFKDEADAKAESAKFPLWDIAPPDQFINPRIKSRQ